MRFLDTPIAGVVEVLLEPHLDERGFFARTWCAQEFADRGLPAGLVQASVSDNGRKGTLRGIHFQWPPSQEGKLVRCERGAVHDVVIDLRPGSTTFLRHFALILDAANGNGLYIPPGCAHGFQTLADETRVGYLMTDIYRQELADGVRWDDPAFNIDWPLPVAMISARDRHYPAFDPVAHEARYALAATGRAG
jgi:dTDP-4-dehydrorhamnose 3,5-epimerase